jgi:hypothetical protein
LVVKSLEAKMRKLSLAIIAAVGAFVAPSGGAEAMPLELPNPHRISNVDQVRWICNPWDVSGGGQTFTLRRLSAIMVTTAMVPALDITADGTSAGGTGKPSFPGAAG